MLFRTPFRLLRALPLRLLVVLHRFALFFGQLLIRLLLLLGRPLGLRLIFAYGTVFGLGVGRYRQCNS